MLLFLKKKSEEPEKIVGAPVKMPPALHDYIPYYCHYDPQTILTKNGELLQIIRIDSNNHGLNYESGDATHNTVRDNIRRALCECLPDNRYSVWVHTLRKRKPISFSAKFTEPFAIYLYDKWQKKNRWKYQYYNEIYVSILYEGQNAELVFDSASMKRTALPKYNRQYRNSYLDEAIVSLEKVTNEVTQKIKQHYRVHRLGMSERISSNMPGQMVFYSEMMEFLGTLLNLRYDTFPVPEADISAALCTHQITFGFNALESKTTAGARRFGALLSLKQYCEVTPDTVDRVLQSPNELIISQAFHFIPAYDALKQYKEQKDLFDMSGDTQSIAASGLAEMLSSNQKSPVDFGNLQTSIMILSDEYKNLDGEVIRIQAAFAELGLITVREDIKLEECFWSQLPGNFEFLRRASPISTTKVAGFSRLNLFPSGNNAGNHWGESVTLIPTSVNSPYFFNFHFQDSGHTAFFDFNSFDDSRGRVLLNFLLTSSLKYRGKCFVFDRKRSTHLLLDKLGGKYYSFLPHVDQRHRKAPALNPFTLEDSPRNRSFLLAWSCSLIESRMTLSDAHKALIREVIDHLYGESPEHRSLNGLVHRLTAVDSELSAAFAEYHGRGKLAGLFDGNTETLSLGDTLQAFDLDQAIRLQCAIPLFSYLLHRIITEIDGRPTIIVLHEAWALLENPFFAPRLDSLLEMLKQNNVTVVFTTHTPLAVTQTHTLATVMKHCTTRLYIPDDVSLAYASPALGLTAHDAKVLLRMDRQRGDFLLKQASEDIALRVGMEDLDDIHAIFANDIKNLIAAGGTYAVLPKDE